MKLGPNHKNGIKRINVGCGPHHIREDWWNVDIRKFEGIDEALDVIQPWAFQDLEYVYGEHFLEHLKLDDALTFLKNSGESLKVGGVLRLTTPNLKWVVLTHSPVGIEPSKVIRQTLVMNRGFYGWGHQFLYTREFLERILSEMGFQDVAFFPYGQSDDPNLRDLEKHGEVWHYGDESSIIVVEARKGRNRIEVPPSLLNYLREEFVIYVESGH